jgi:predicted amidophosphoribosyltransferase
MSVNPNFEIMCCLGCGRDTTASGGCCYRCIGRGQQGVDERKDRPVVRFDGNPICNITGVSYDDYGEEAMRPAKYENQ